MFRWIIAMMAGVGVVGVAGFEVRAIVGQEVREELPDARLYDPDPEHLWNRLHRALFVRQARDGRWYGLAEVDPMLWDDSTYLLNGESAKRAEGVLGEFVEKHGERLIADPVKRAILQADLWAIFDWLAEKGIQGGAMQTRLAQIMRRMALTEEEIAKLPENYAELVKTRRYAEAFDEQHPERPFLPPDLLEENGAWVKVGTFGEVIAPAHTKQAMGRSLFLVIMQLPGGRAATEGYLKQVREFPEPWVQTGEAQRPLEINPALPQFPAGTQVALVRQMVVADAKGNLRVTPVVQSVQMRVYRKIAWVGRLPNDRRNQDVQALAEFELSRQGLFAGKGESLVAADRETEKFHLLNPLPGDLVEMPRGAQRFKVMNGCVDCHNEAGVFSLITYTRRFGPRNVMPPALEATGRERQAMFVERWKKATYEWGLLKGMWEGGE